MSKFDFSSITYNKILAKAYDPKLSKKERKYLLNYFLKFKSETVNNMAGTNKDVEDVLVHLKSQLNQGFSFTSVTEHPIISSLIVAAIVGCVNYFYDNNKTKHIETHSLNSKETTDDSQPK